MRDEKFKEPYRSQLPIAIHDKRTTGPKTKRKASRVACRACVSLLACALLYLLGTGSAIGPLFGQRSSISVVSQKHTASEKLSNSDCAQVQPWQPDEKVQLPQAPSLDTLAKLLSGAVQVNTSTYDDYPLPVSSDPRLWNDVFSPFRDYLYKTFPEIHFSSTVNIEHVNEHGLLYTWPGQNKTLKPIVFMAHQDVVPVDPQTLKLWEHGAFSGFVDREKGLVYGRGASDDKASLIMLLTSVTSLLKQGFKPERTIVLSFGFDEETSGTQGGQMLAQRLEQIYGSHKDGKGAFMIVDEGNSVERDVYGLTVAEPAVAEKGYLDVRITVHTPGGHSSVPPKHTSIGLLSKVISAIEDAPWQTTLSIREQSRHRQDSPGLETLLCIRDAPKLRTTSLGKALNRLADARANYDRRIEDNARRNGSWIGRLMSCAEHMLHQKDQASAKGALEKARKELHTLLDASDFANDFRTTQAVDLIYGGVKINALPEEATVVINHRINVEESVSDVRKHLLNAASYIAKTYGLGIQAWQNKTEFERHEKDAQKRLRYIELSDAFDSALEPAPRTPTQGKEASPFRLLSSVIRHTYAAGNTGSTSGSGSGSDVRVVPTLMGGNTDTKSYWRLSRHIFRFAPSSLQPLPKGYEQDGIHTINEVVQIDSLAAAFRFYTAMMIAAQEYTGA